MKKRNVFIIIVLFIVLAVISVIFLNRYENKPYKHQTFITTNNVYNVTDLKFVDTITHVTLNKLKIENVNIIIKKMNPKLNAYLGDDLTLEAAIVKGENGYIMYIRSLSHRSAIKYICHELIHLQQYNSNELLPSGYFPIWNGKAYSIKDTPYKDRPWEVDAFAKQDELIADITKILY